MPLGILFLLSLLLHPSDMAPILAHSILCSAWGSSRLNYVLPWRARSLCMLYRQNIICLFASIWDFSLDFSIESIMCVTHYRNNKGFKVIEMTLEVLQWFPYGRTLTAHWILDLTFYCLLGQIHFLNLHFNWPLNFKRHSFILLWGLYSYVH